MGPLFGVGDAGTGLPKNQACPLIEPPRSPEGDLREAGNRGWLRQRVAIGNKKEANKTAGQKQWRQTAHKIYKTPSLITFVKQKRPCRSFWSMERSCRGLSPGSTISACCCGATVIRSLSTSMRFRPSCPALRSSYSKAARMLRLESDLIGTPTSGTGG